MTTLERLIWERDHSDSVHEWDRYDTLAQQIESGLLSPDEAAQSAGFVPSGKLIGD